MLDLVLQIWILLTGGLALYLLTCRAPWMRWGFVLGLAAQPAWMVSFLIHDQYGMGLLCLFYTYAWGRGVFKYFGKERRGQYVT